MKRLLRQVFWCLAAAAVVPLVAYIFTEGRISSSRMAWMLAVSLIFALCISVPLEYALHHVTPLLRGRSHWVSVPLYGLFLMVFAVFGTLLGTAVICGVGLLQWEAYWQMARDAVQLSLLLTLLFGIGGMAAGAMELRLNEANELLRQKEEEERRARAMATEARLQSLESRVHPHFLFNAINSILALIREDPRRAEDLLERMAALLRFSLDAGDTRLVPLERELTIVRDYLEIEAARFGGRLRYEVTAAGMEGVQVPPLAVQTLVENSVKYAVSPRREGGRISVRAFRQGGEVCVEVADDGPGFAEGDVRAGHGIDLVRQRLAGVGRLELDQASGDPVGMPPGMTPGMPLGMAVRVWMAPSL